MIRKPYMWSVIRCYILVYYASDLMDQPLKVLCELGGWKTAQTVLKCYQRADQARLRKALEHRARALS